MSAHAKHLIIAALFAAVILVTTWKVIAYQGNIAHDQKVLAEEKLKNDLDTAKIQAQATATDKAALQAQLNALSASNAALQRDLATLRAQLANQRQQDAAMPPDALSLRWSDLLGMPGQVQPSQTQTADGRIAFCCITTNEAAHATVSQLEEIPILQQEKKKIADESAKKDTAIEQAKKTLASTEAELDTCKATIVDSQAVCKAQIVEVKAKARKRNIVVAVLAAIFGFAVRAKI